MIEDGVDLTEYDTISDALDEQLEAIETRDDYAAALRSLADFYDRKFVEQQPLRELIGGIWGAIGHEIDRLEEFQSDIGKYPNWRLFGCIDETALYHT